MRKIFQSKMTTLVMALGMGALAVSCAQDVDDIKQGAETPLAGNGEVRLRFAIAGEKTTTDGTKTRATMLDNIGAMPDDATFGVYGYACKKGEAMGNDPNLIDNGSVKKDGVVKIRGKVADYSGTPCVQFAAVYPRLGGNDSFKKTGKSTYELTYALTEDMAVQKDLMVGQTDEFEIPATATDQVKSDKTVAMHHALTSVNFAIGDRLTVGYDIHGIEFRGVHVKGSCTVDMEKLTDAERFKWTPVGDRGKVHIKMPKISTSQVNGKVFTGLKGEDHKRDALTVFMIPQPLTAEAVAVVYLKESLNNPTPDVKPAMKKIVFPLMKATPEITTYKAGEQVVYYLNDTETEDPNGYRFDVPRTSIFSNRKKSAILTVTSYKFKNKKGGKGEKLYQSQQSWRIVQIKYNDGNDTGEKELDVNNLPSWLTVSPIEFPMDTPSTLRTVKVTVTVNPNDPTYPPVSFIAGNRAYLQIHFKQDGTGTEKPIRITRMPAKPTNSN